MNPLLSFIKNEELCRKQRYFFLTFFFFSFSFLKASYPAMYGGDKTEYAAQPPQYQQNQSQPHFQQPPPQYQNPTTPSYSSPPAYNPEVDPPAYNAQVPPVNVYGGNTGVNPN